MFFFCELYSSVADWFWLRQIYRCWSHWGGEVWLLLSSIDGVWFCGLKLSLIGSDGEETEETEEKDVVAFRDVERGVESEKDFMGDDGDL